MGGMLKPKIKGGTTTVEAPSVAPVRMPMMDDPSVLAAADRARASAMKRKGRMSTIMTDRTKAVSNPSATPTGSSGKAMGA